MSFRLGPADCNKPFVCISHKTDKYWTHKSYNICDKTTFKDVRYEAIMNRKEEVELNEQNC